MTTYQVKPDVPGNATAADQQQLAKRIKAARIGEDILLRYSANTSKGVQPKEWMFGKFEVASTSHHPTQNSGDVVELFGFVEGFGNAKLAVYPNYNSGIVLTRR